MHGVCLIQIFQLDFFCCCFGLVCSFVSISIRFRITGGRVRLFMCRSERAPAWNDHFLPFGGKNVYIADIGASESNRTLHTLCVSLALSLAGRVVVVRQHTINEIALAFMYFLRRFVYIFSTFCHLPYSFRQFSIELLLFSSSWIRFGPSFVSFVCLVALLVTWSYETKRGSWTLCQRR